MPKRRASAHACGTGELERRLIRFHADRMINNPYSGRTLPRLFRRQNLQEISIDVWPVVLTDYSFARRMGRLDQIEQEALAAGAIDREDSVRWRASLDRAVAANGFFSSTNGVTVAGRKP